MTKDRSNVDRFVDEEGKGGRDGFDFLRELEFAWPSIDSQWREAELTTSF